MTTVQATRLLDLAGFDGWDIINVTVGPNDDPLILLWEHPDDLPEDPDEHKYPGQTLQRRILAGPNSFRVVHFHAGRRAIMDLPETTLDYRFVQPLGDREYVVAAPWPRDERPNAHVYSADSRPLRSFYAGGGVQHVQATAGGLIWVGHSDEGIFKSVLPDLGPEGVNCFNANGRAEFGFNSLLLRNTFLWQNGLNDIADCYAMNAVSDEETWIWYYVEFPLVRIADGWIDAFWPNVVDKAPLRGSHAFAVADDRILFRGGYRDRDRLYLVALNGPRSQELLPVDSDGNHIAEFRAFGRGSKLYLRTEEALHMINAADLPPF